MTRHEYNRLLAEFDLGEVKYGMSFKAAKAQRAALVAAIAALPRRDGAKSDYIHLHITPIRTVAAWIMDAANYGVWSETLWHRQNGC